MMRFKNKDSLPATPKSWTVKETGYRIPFDSVRSTYEAFIQRVMQYYDANNIPRPNLLEIEDHICGQISGWACTSEENYVARQRKVKPEGVSYGGCKSCGGRK